MQSDTPGELFERRAALCRDYAELYEKALALFFKYDPMGINFEENTDEYEPEVGTVLPRLSSCSNIADVQLVLFEEFERWFGVGGAGKMRHYGAIATELWQLWCSSRRSRADG